MVGELVEPLVERISIIKGGNRKIKKFKTKNLREFLAANSHFPIKQQGQLMETTFVNWKRNLEQIDDVTVIGVRI